LVARTRARLGGQRILMRVSHSADALTIRAKPSDHGNLQLIQ
jgi:hypothetical protein